MTPARKERVGCRLPTLRSGLGSPPPPWWWRQSPSINRLLWTNLPDPFARLSYAMNGTCAPPALDFMPLVDSPGKWLVWLLAGLSVLSCAVLLVLYAVVRAPWLRRHPNRVFVFRAKMELALALLVLVACSADPAALWHEYDHVGHGMTKCESLSYANPHRRATFFPAGVLAWLGQYCLLGSELWYAVIVHDLASSVDNPFSSYQLRSRRYTLGVHGTAAFVACCMFALSGSCDGTMGLGRCGYGGRVWGFVWLQARVVCCWLALFYAPRCPGNDVIIAVGKGRCKTCVVRSLPRAAVLGPVLRLADLRVLLPLARRDLRLRHRDGRARAAPLRARPVII